MAPYSDITPRVNMLTKEQRRFRACQLINQLLVPIENIRSVWITIISLHLWNKWCMNPDLLFQRLRNAVGFDGQSSEDQSQSPVRADSDIYQNPSSDSDKVYYQLSASMPRAKRHSDAIFTNEYSKLLGEIAARKYLESLMGKRTQDEHNASKRHSDAVFTHMYTTLLQEKAAKEFLERIANGQTSSQQDPNSADTLDNPSPVENYVSDAI
ncbi:VIP peptides-like isoform X4 [Chiloscyllium plagiosum]|uniref:VIP peptides-like isoform X4 n=1 Tax=Chiloscyllium plagiosum TaxID=36176 RepID=UPI001CB86F44|nr:VIP peptides-like isoform X4 [Chiloscyllium plagiosum]